MNINDLSEIIPALLILAGTIMSFLSAVGLVRLPDVYTRSHAASKSATLGVLFTLVGTLFFFVITQGIFSIRLLLGIFFVFLTAPVSAHLICRSAYRSNVKLTETSVMDTLKDALREGK
ncbi:monovalent cation/H(+) antiporter subunit G [Bacillus sp. FJAT-27251]|uniref:monovalent cation/H(+) antiporter subunit G n=1 Tax=Bacillus sp. FJAT-27251 TaxID=1684142 RepID=UPI0006A76783|nr:monovalent cation/H(+) antiporter subunit G [Bacillus sp. FJAT-27251]